MRKKVIALLVSFTVLTSLLAGCGNNGNQTASTGVENSNTSSVASAPGQTSTDEITEIIWQYPTTMDTNSEGFRKMENKLNEMMERDIGVHVTFEPVGLSESQNSAALMISTGEQLDIMLSAFTSMGNVVDKGLVMPLDDLLEEYGQDILEKSFTQEMCGYDGKTYGVTTGDTIGSAYGYMMKKQYWDKYNLAELFDYTEDKVFTIDEIEEIFAIIKAGEGDNFYCTIPWNTTQDPLNNSYIEYDKPTGSLSGGVLMLNRDFTDTTVYNLFETPEYEEYCNMLYDWAQKGYISSDAAVSTEASVTTYLQPNYLGMFYWHYKEDMNEFQSSVPEPIISLQILPYYMAFRGGSTIQWSIPITSVNPEKAMEALNYIYKNNEAAWLIMFGIEGEEYEVTAEDGEQIQIRYLADDITSLPYYMPYGIWGDRLSWPVPEPSDMSLNGKKRQVMDECPESRKSPIFGYSFKSQAVSTEIAAVESVIAQYTPSLNAGALDPAKALPEFLSALKAAGMDQIIAEQQAQIDAWLAER